MMTRDEFLDELNGFRDLADNWDSYGASKITENAITASIELADEIAGPWTSTLTRPRSVSPSPDGGISFEYYGFRRRADIWVSHSGQTAEIMIIDNIYTELPSMPIEGAPGMMKFFLSQQETYQCSECRRRGGHE